LQNGYWHARGHEYLGTSLARMVEWARLPGDAIFIFLGVAPLLWIATNAYWSISRAQVVRSRVSARPSLRESAAVD
jgi:nitric oxide reductase subunit B